MTAPSYDGIPPIKQDRSVQLWAAAGGVSALGDTVWLIALAWSAVHLVGPAAAGLLIGIGTLPRAALILVGGGLADRHNTWPIVVAMNAARVAVLGLGALTLGHVGPSFGVLAAVALAFGVADALYNPAASTMPRQMVRPEDLGPVMGMFQASGRLGRLAGAPLGGVLVAAFGLQSAMLVDAATFLVIGAVMFWFVRPRIPRTLSRGHSLRHDVVTGLAYVRRTTTVRTLVIALSGLNLFVSPALAVGLALRVSHQGWGAGTLGILDACVGGGAVVGALTATRWRPTRPATAGLLVLVVQGAGIAALGFGPRASVGVATVVIGITAGLASAFLSGAFQAAIASEFLGRTSALTSLADDGLMPVAMVAFGLLASATSVLAACAIAGAGMALVSVWSATRPGIREIRPGNATAETSTGQATTQAA